MTVDEKLRAKVNEILKILEDNFVKTPKEPKEECNHLFQCERCGWVQNERGPFDEKPPTKLPEKLDENNYKERKPVIRAINSLIDYLAKDR